MRVEIFHHSFSGTDRAWPACDRVCFPPLSSQTPTGPVPVTTGISVAFGAAVNTSSATSVSSLFHADFEWSTQISNFQIQLQQRLLQYAPTICSVTLQPSVSCLGLVFGLCRACVVRVGDIVGVWLVCIGVCRAPPGVHVLCVSVCWLVLLLLTLSSPTTPHRRT